MMPKLICKLFGHITKESFYSGETAIVTDRLTGRDRTVPVMYEKKAESCPRCHVKLIEAENT